MPKAFLSYVRENAATVQRLAADLRAHGIEVWLDKEQIPAGTRWEDEIRRGISKGDVFIACFSNEYIARDKSYMNEELTQAIEQLRLRPTTRAWFIPVLLSPCEVPDRSIGGGETLRSIQSVAIYEDWHAGMRGIVSSVVPSNLWIPYEIAGPEGTTFVLLPLRPSDGTVAAIGKHPITNEQYRQFVKTHPYRISKPIGSQFVAEPHPHWQGPFSPWDTPEFSLADQPVVCVSYEDAEFYRTWANAHIAQSSRPVAYGRFTTGIHLPSPRLWDIAAFGALVVPETAPQWLGIQTSVHHRASAPATIDRSGARTNARGVSDLIGNIWEWCWDIDPFEPPVLGGPFSFAAPELRGGGFLDDLERTRPVIGSWMLKHRIDTQHADLGFRIAAILEASAMPIEVRERLGTAAFSVADCFKSLRIPPTA
jgi:hypothetical protein